MSKLSFTFALTAVHPLNRCSTSAAVFLFEMLTYVTHIVTAKQLILKVVTLFTAVTGFFSHTTHTHA